MKNILLGLAFALISNMTYASQGIFVSGNAGGLFQSGKHIYTNDAAKEGKQELKSFGGVVSGGLGYLHELSESKIVFGLETFVGMSTVNSKKDLQVKDGSAEGKVGIKPRAFFGASILTGMAINPRVILYGRLGYEFTRFSFEYADLTFQTPTAQKYTKTLKGLAPGAGAFYKLTDKILLGGEYVFSMQGKVKLREETATINGAKRGYTFSGHAQRVMARLIYVF